MNNYSLEIFRKTATDAHKVLEGYKTLKSSKSLKGLESTCPHSAGLGTERKRNTIINHP